jgi:hypothetical protein
MTIFSHEWLEGHLSTSNHLEMHGTRASVNRTMQRHLEKFMAHAVRIHLVRSDSIIEQVFEVWRGNRASLASGDDLTKD